jgi:hypothetical protein
MSRTPVARTTTWLTPPEILRPLGHFDLDPCAAPLPRPWDTAQVMWTEADNPLDRPWFGRVWLNPPFSPRTTLDAFLSRMADHRRGIALLFARTETQTFFDDVWRVAHSVLFIKGRPHFHDAAGVRAAGNSGAPVVLVSYSSEDTVALIQSGIPGQLVVPA